MPKRTLSAERLLDSIVSDLEHQRPAMTKKHADELEATLHERWSATRREGLASLTVNGKSLIKSIASRRVDQAVATEKLRLAFALRAYAERLRGFALLMESASTRISLAARWRDDYEAVADAASRNELSAGAPQST
jgi:hypothetical protein